MRRAFEQFASPMLRIRRAATISAEQELSVFPECRSQKIKCCLNSWLAFS